MRPQQICLGAVMTVAAVVPVLYVAPPLAAALPVPAGCAGAALAEPGEGPPDYYAVDLVSTRRLPGTRGATGVGEVTFAPSPFGVSVAPGGTYRQHLSVKVEGLPDPGDDHYVVWVTTPQLDQIRRLGEIEPAGRLEDRVEWNKFLVVVSVESAETADESSWQGPIVLRGMSRSGRMHTMAGHGPFQAEPCAQYGY